MQAKTLGQTGVHVVSKGALGWSARSDRIHLSRIIKAGCLTPIEKCTAGISIEKNHEYQYPVAVVMQ